MIKLQVSPSRIGIALAAALLLLSVPTLSGAAPTAQQCQSAWSQSSANETCDHERIRVSGEKCSIGVSCTDANGGSVGQNYLYSLEHVDDLHNCDGVLKVGSC